MITYDYMILKSTLSMDIDGCIWVYMAKKHGSFVDRTINLG